MDLALLQSSRRARRAFSNHVDRKLAKFALDTTGGIQPPFSQVYAARRRECGFATSAIAV
jgi:hypothetical protein